MAFHCLHPPHIYAVRQRTASAKEVEGRTRSTAIKVETEYCRTRHPCKSDGTRPIEDPESSGVVEPVADETGARI